MFLMQLIYCRVLMPENYRGYVPQVGESSPEWARKWRQWGQKRFVGSSVQDPEDNRCDQDGRVLLPTRLRQQIMNT